MYFSQLPGLRPLLTEHHRHKILLIQLNLSLTIWHIVRLKAQYNEGLVFRTNKRILSVFLLGPWVLWN